jgi:hypothetical protein
MMVDPLLLRAVLAAVKANQTRPTVIKPGKVISVTNDQQIANVDIDGDDLMTDDGGNDQLPDLGFTPCQILIGSGIMAGDRVMVLYAPPSGAYVIGRYAGDFNPWTNIGFGVEIPFVSPWQPAAGVGLPGEPNTFQTPGVRRIGRMVELRGHAARNGGVAPNPDTIFVLPPNFRPQNDLLIPAVCGPIAVPSFAIVQGTGEVQALITTGSTEISAGGYFSLDGIVFSADSLSV